VTTTSERPETNRTIVDANCPDNARRRDAELLEAAQKVIADACRFRPDQAFDALVDAAQHYHLSTVQLARGLLDLVADLPRIDHDLRGASAAAFAQWGRLLSESRLDTTGSR
jgi:hypothetical protein